LYAVFLWATQAGVMDFKSWPLMRVATLDIVALALVLGSFIYFAHFSGAPPGSTYVPAHMENGKFVPGTTKRCSRRRAVPIGNWTTPAGSQAAGCRACSLCSIATAKRRASSAARCETHCWACRSPRL